MCLGQEASDVQDFREGHLEKSAGGLDAVAVGQAEGIEDEAALLRVAGPKVLQQGMC